MNKIIYIGMDVHSTNFTLCSFQPGYGIDADKIFGQTQIKEDIFNSTVKYINKLKSMRPDVDVICGYEAGCLGYNLHRKLKAKEIEKTVEDENGKKKTIKETINVTDGSLPNEYARYFEQYTKDDSGNIVRNPNWEENSDYNLFFLSGVQNYANDKLTVNKILFLNEVYEMLGLPKTKAGQMVGWIYDPTNPETDSYVDFGIDEDNIMYNENGDILLDFNPDGNIWKLM